MRLRWTDMPYFWHVNDGREVFAVLDGAFEMHVRRGDVEKVYRLEVGDVSYADIGAEYGAHPIGPRRVLVVEREASI